MPRVGAARPGGALVHPFLDDLGAEFFRGALDRIRIVDVGGIDPPDQEPVVPLLPDEILRQRVRQLVMAEGGVDDIRAALLLAQPVIRRADIEQHDILTLRRVRERQHRVGRRVDQNEPRAPRDQRVEGCDGVAARGHGFGGEREGLLHEAAGRIVVVEPDLRPGHAVVGRRIIEPRDWQEPLHLQFEVADRDRGDVGGGRLGVCGRGFRRGRRDFRRGRRCSRSGGGGLRRGLGVLSGEGRRQEEGGQHRKRCDACSRALPDESAWLREGHM
jgi:hypothetical protein